MKHMQAFVNNMFVAVVSDVHFTSPETTSTTDLTTSHYMDISVRRRSNSMTGSL